MRVLGYEELASPSLAVLRRTGGGSSSPFYLAKDSSLGITGLLGSTVSYKGLWHETPASLYQCDSG